MKKLGKALLGLLAAVAMLVTGLVAPTTAFADDETSAATTKYSITINNTVKGYTYKAYQVFSGTLSTESGRQTLSDIEWGDGVDGTELLKELTGLDKDTKDTNLAKLLLTKTEGEGDQEKTVTYNPFKDAKDAKDVAKVLSGQTSTVDKTSEFMQAFAKVVGKHLNNKTDETAGTTDKGHESSPVLRDENNQDGDITGYRISGLDAGYYIVLNTTVPGKDATGEDVNDENSKSAYTEFILQLVADVNVAPKSEVPTLTKKVQEKNDSAAESDKSTPKNPTDWQDGADYDVNDNVPFQLTATLPKDATRFAAYEKYHLTFHDKQSVGLTFNDDAKLTLKHDVTTKTDAGEKTETKETVIPAKGTKDGVEHTNYTVTWSGATKDADKTTDGDTFDIAFKDVKDLYDANGDKIEVAAGDRIVVDYTAKLNDKAVIGKPGNPNEARLTYSNNPNNEGDGESGHTPWDKVTVFTFTIEANKVGEDGTTSLKGAGFTLYKWENTAKKGETAKFGWKEVSVIAPVYKKATDTTDADHKDADGNLLDDDGNKVVDEDKTPTTFTWKQIDSGTYKLEESTVPLGYDKAEDQYFVVEATYDTDYDNNDADKKELDPEDLTLNIYKGTVTTDDKGNVTAVTKGDKLNTEKTDASWSIKDEVIKETGKGSVTHQQAIASTTIVNKKGSSLPETGGMGTVILYALGGAFVVAAGLWFGLRRRFSNR
ncbi:isopeptide-forming domain-containing fimbrial protein [Bifidobacterium biavatii]|uniref:Peptidoglycan linked protein (Fimbrial structural unit) (LPXTG motif) n=1 Tax=Bifidobacterium biavatii DSM 23969 TaxID=1437608 RepID=A0A086ZVZ6_9BIFI|nr:isopeptide-forming domain-containing fimbrial protein [Bifidobacterium biavatii]KFI50696.1 peptidoglycan linked protein (fimbrial structural unit) (LPXTG motif) [Bifidobacterium biavatii DSM 23969]